MTAHAWTVLAWIAGIPLVWLAADIVSRLLTRAIIKARLRKPPGTVDEQD